MDLALAKKTVLITGGTSGIGLATARMMVQEGARVLVVGRSQERFVQLPENLRQGLTFYQGDIGSLDVCKTIIKGAVEKYGKLAVLVNCAGIYRESRLESSREEDYNLIMDTNVKGTMNMTKEAIPYLEQGSAIINIASDAGISGNYGCPVYCASKGAVVAFTRAMALDLAPKIRVNCICPGDVDTPLVTAQLATGGYTKEEMAAEYPLGRIADPEEVAYVICSLASPRNSFMTGAVIPIDGGLTAS